MPVDSICRSFELKLIKAHKLQCSSLPLQNRQASLDLLLKSARQQHSSSLRSFSFRFSLPSSSSPPLSTAAAVTLQGQMVEQSGQIRTTPTLTRIILEMLFACENNQCLQVVFVKSSILTEAPKQQENNKKVGKHQYCEIQPSSYKG